MMWPGRLAGEASIRLAATESSLKATTSQLAAIDCTAVVKLNRRGEWPDSRADCSMV